jgi:hypothetical protein
MPPAGFEPTSLAFYRANAVHDLYSAATAIAQNCINMNWNILWIKVLLINKKIISMASYAYVGQAEIFNPLSRFQERTL